MNKPNHKDAENTLLMKYLEGNLSGDELHAFEKEMLDSDIMNDAVEGLQLLEDKEKINNYVADLNKQLKTFTASKRKRRNKFRIQLSQWTIISIIIILFICIITFLLIKFYL